MSRGGKESTNLENLGCSPETIQRLRLSVYEREESISKEHLLKVYDSLVYLYFTGHETDADAPKELAKAKKTARRDTLSDLVLKVCALANMVNGAYIASEAKRNATRDCLNDALEPSRKIMAERETEKGKKAAALEPARSDYQAAVDATFRIRLQDIIIGALEKKGNNV